MDSENNNIDDLFHDFFKEKITGKGVNQDANLPGHIPPTPSNPETKKATSIIPNNAPNIIPPIPRTVPPPPINNISEQTRAQIPLSDVIKRSEEVDEILSFVPNWIIRWGTALLFLIIMMLVTLSYFIKYPDVVPGKITLTSTNPPAEVVSRNNGAFVLYKKDKSIVGQDDVIALLKNNANYKDVQKLKSDLIFFKQKMSNNQYVKLNENYVVGDLQNAYGKLIMSLKGHALVKNSANNNFQRKQNINQQIKELKNISFKQKQSVDILEREYLAGQETLKNRYLPLFKSGSISKEQLESKQSEVRQQLNLLQTAKVTLNENRNRVLDLISQKSELDYSGNDKMLTSKNEISDAYNNLLNQITNWEQQYLLKAPIAGKLNYLEFVKDNMYVKSDQLLANIIPSGDNISGTDSTIIIGELFIGTEGSGKVETGQVVNIELNDFIKKEFGLLRGEVESIGDIGTSIATAEGQNASYKVKVRLTNGLETTYNKDIRFKHNMQGRAEIITKDVRLLERIFAELRAAFEND